MAEALGKSQMTNDQRSECEASTGSTSNLEIKTGSRSEAVEPASVPGCGAFMPVATEHQPIVIERLELAPDRLQPDDGEPYSPCFTSGGTSAPWSSAGRCCSPGYCGVGREESGFTASRTMQDCS
jgi:hypothetical protein